MNRRHAVCRPHLNREVAEVVRYIRQHACDGLRMKDLVERTVLTPVTLKRRFQRVLGRSPKAEIVRVQLARAKQLLADTDFNLSQIALAAGFGYPEYLIAVFKKKTGQTPGQYRAAVERLAPVPPHVG